MFSSKPRQAVGFSAELKHARGFSLNLEQARRVLIVATTTAATLQRPAPHAADRLNQSAASDCAKPSPGSTSNETGKHATSHTICSTAGQTMIMLHFG
jgi:hypothetical protein